MVCCQGHIESLGFNGMLLLADRFHYCNIIMLKIEEFLFKNPIKKIIAPANEVAGVYSDPYVRPFVRPSVHPSVRPSLPISNLLLL